MSLDPTYLLQMITSHNMLFSVRSLYSHLLRSAMFLSSRMPKPPWPLGRHNTFHLATLVFNYNNSTLIDPNDGNALAVSSSRLEYRRQTKKQTTTEPEQKLCSWLTGMW